MVKYAYIYLNFHLKTSLLSISPRAQNINNNKTNCYLRSHTEGKHTYTNNNKILRNIEQINANNTYYTYRSYTIEQKQDHPSSLQWEWTNKNGRGARQMATQQNNTANYFIFQNQSKMLICFSAKMRQITTTSQQQQKQNIFANVSKN